MRKKILIITIICFSCLLLITDFAVADKPEWAGKGKSTREEVSSHKKERKDDNAYDSEDSDRQKEEKLKKEKEKVNKGETSKGLEKQKDKKSLQEQKELDKGSEKGKESRQKRKKWWKFWE